ncbi:MAG: amidohydrolase family protein [Treponema sp.]|jgi:N-acyl-D-amino-acid deacylase|nr:amidohydrolase family protein [Treponema sp.]
MLDYLIINARIIDPESESDFSGSLGIKAGKIDGVYRDYVALPSAKETIDAETGILVPGFIDIHAHSENNIPCAEKLLAMGVTTAVSGNCGYCAVDLRSFFAAFEKDGYPVNQLEQAGHSILRRMAGLFDINAPASVKQKEKMKLLASQAFSCGACGLSFGLEYDPGASPEEVLELSRVAADAGRFVSIHGRLRYLDDLDSLREALDIAETGAQVIYSHLVYMYNGNALKEAMRIITEYREKGANIWVDSGMYTAFATFAGSPCFEEKIFLNDDAETKKLRAASGKYTGEILDRDKYIEIRAKYPEDRLIYDPGKNDDVFTAYSLPDVMVSTDCMEYPAGQGHPQDAATYPYFFRTLVKEKRQLSLLEAVKRCTLLPAKAAGLETKGRLSCGMCADIAVLDWERLRENATFPGKGDPGAPPSGVEHVFVNGVLSIKNEKRIPGVLAGFCIKR